MKKRYQSAVLTSSRKFLPDFLNYFKSTPGEMVLITTPQNSPSEDLNGYFRFCVQSPHFLCSTSGLGYRLPLTLLLETFSEYIYRTRQLYPGSSFFCVVFGLTWVSVSLVCFGAGLTKFCFYAALVFLVYLTLLIISQRKHTSTTQKRNAQSRFELKAPHF